MPSTALGTPMSGRKEGGNMVAFKNSTPTHVSPDELMARAKLVSRLLEVMDQIPQPPSRSRRDSTGKPTRPPTTRN